jgi:hypothetical protein
MVELLVRRHATARGTGAAGVGVAIAVTGAVGDAEGRTRRFEPVRQLDKLDATAVTAVTLIYCAGRPRR